MGVLLMLMTIGGSISALVLLIIARVSGKTWLKHFAWGGITTWFVGYLFLLFCASFFSVEKTLALNESKEFCGFYLDCHLHAAVTGVRKIKMLGDKTANGEFYVVKIKVFSDAKRASLGLITVDARAIDAQKREYARNIKAELQLGEQPLLEQKLSPGESVEREIVFDLPPEISGLRLDIREGYGVDHAIETVLIGDEDSLFHKRTLFSLEQPQSSSALY